MISFKQFLLLEGQLEKHFKEDPEEVVKKAVARWRKLTPKQKEQIPNPQKYQDLKSFIKDLEAAEKFVSKTAKEKQVKQSGIQGLKKGEDYLEFETGNPDIQAYAPLNYEASKLIASQRIGSCEGRWCTAYQKDSKYWENYTLDKKGALIYFITPETKYASLYLPNGDWQLFDAEDNELKGEEKNKFPIASEMSKHYKQIRKRLPQSWDELAEEGDVVEIMKRLDVKNYKVRSDNKVDIDGDITSLAYKGFTKLPVKFGKVSGNFDCAGNNLESLEGAPEYVGGNFECGWNGRSDLSNLKGAPEYVGGNFDCSYNTRISSVEGVSKYIGGDFLCTNTRLSVEDTQAEFERLGVELKGKIKGRKIK